MKRLIFILPVLGLGVAAFFMSRPSVAASIVDECKDLGENESLSCYNAEIPQLFPERPLPEVFDIIREIRQLDPGYQFCHVVGHKLGERAVAQDPSRWFDMMPQNPPDGLCSNGFIHGLIVGRFRNDVLDEATMEKTMPDFARACEPRPDWSPSPMDQAICYHGAGHLFLFITSADVRRSLDACEKIGISPSGDFMKVCREGVFMQIYQPLEPDDFALVELLPEKPTRENYRRLCALYAKDEEEGACLREAWPLFREEILYGAGGAAFCAGEPNRDEEDACYLTVSTIIGRQLLGNEEKAARACEGLPESRRGECFVAASMAFLEEDRRDGGKAIALCKRAESPDSCIATLAERAGWIYGADEKARRAFCKLLPKEYRAACAGA